MGCVPYILNQKNTVHLAPTKNINNANQRLKSIRKTPGAFTMWKKVNPQAFIRENLFPYRFA